MMGGKGATISVPLGSVASYHVYADVRQHIPMTRIIAFISYLPAFSVGIESGKAEGLMCSYNAETYGAGIHGNSTAVPSCANSYLLNGLAREKWGFDGYITSDCGALSDIDGNEHAQNGCSGPAGCGHNYSNGVLDSVHTALSAGMDTDCRYV